MLGRTRVHTMLLNTRKKVWHLRHGGLTQLKVFIQRERALGRNQGSLAQGAQGSGLLWGQEAVAEVPAVRKDARLGSGYRLEFDPLRALPLPKTYPGVKVAVILDDFSLQAWGAEFETLVLRPDTWQAQLDETPVDFLLVESAWAGNGGAWQYHLTGPSAPRPAVLALVTWCREHKIPTVFWNKEDPPHFDDFLATARLFDYVLTSDSNTVPRYTQELGHERVSPLSFAAAPSVHNPVRASGFVASRGVAFAGTYFAHKFPERREQMDALLTGALVAARKSKEPFEIYSRFWGRGERYQFPEPFDGQVVGSLPYPAMVRAYKAHKVFLNVNSVVDSPSMCARRIFEILASGTAVVTTGSAAVRNFFDEEQVLVADDAEQAELKIRALLNSSMLRGRSVHLAQREIWARHTYAHRAQQLMDTLGLPAQPHPRSLVASPLVSVLAPTMRPQQLGHVFETVGRQKDVRVQLVALTHGFEVPQQAAQELADQHGLADVVLLSADSDLTLGACLNLMVARAAGNVLAKIDDDDLYGDYYLRDMINALRFSGADVVGKSAYYVYLEGHNVTVLRRPEIEHRFTDFIAGPTLVGWAETFRAHPFEDRTRGEDTAFVRSVVDSGGLVYATDRYNFVQRRLADQSHTWQVDDYLLLANGQATYAGLNRADMMF